MAKVTIIGGGGIRTPLVIHGIVEARERLGVREIALYDIDRERVELMAGLGREAARQLGGEVEITTPPSLEDAAAGARFIIHSIRVGGMAARARDERLAIEHGIAGQETTGLGGFAKALRTVPVAIEQARVIERHAPEAWFISFTNPAGLMAQALLTHTNVRAIGICDTPSEMFHRIAQGLGEKLEDVRCDYFGLNHLGWIRQVLVRGRDVMPQLLANEAALRGIYHADLFDPAMIRAMGLIPSEYLFFYYCQQRALANQRAAGASRGEEIERLNAGLFDSLRGALRGGRSAEALEQYRDYLRRRSGSYMKLEAEAGSALAAGVEQQEDPFSAATGYHRIAIEVMTALVSDAPSRIVLNVRNAGAIPDLAADDVIEAPCLIDRHGPQPVAVGPLPEAVAGLVRAVKQYERLTIHAAVENSASLARLALMTYPLVGQWEPADRLVAALSELKRNTTA
ncbi:MAG: 6-phospho-beta-glucosidase [Blastocatellia bacterium]|nr:6-phospho-beta-glucosidase [Blastocatellia bacterium]